MEFFNHMKWNIVKKYGLDKTQFYRIRSRDEFVWTGQCISLLSVVDQFSIAINKKIWGKHCASAKQTKVLTAEGKFIPSTKVKLYLPYAMLV